MKENQESLADQTKAPRMLRLEVGPPVFAITASRKDSCIVISSARLTPLGNVIWVNIWCFMWHWPPITHFQGFTYTDEPEATDETAIQR